MADYPIPFGALADHIGILGKTGRGKSYMTQGLVEKLIQRKERVCIIDPVDRYWGLRITADGSKPSKFEPVIIGGQHADMPLSAAAGAALAEIVGTTTTPVIIVTRLLTVAERTRFFTDFAETLLRRNKGPLHLMIDEAHLFMPQGGASVGGNAPAMLHAGNNLVSLGRGIGLRIALISQRPAKLHKDALTQVETLIAFGLTAPQDRNAVREWVRESADEVTGAEMMSSLPSLPTGTAWVWAPSLDCLWKRPFPPITTFDSGKPLAAEETPTLKPIDLAALRGQLETVAEEAFANDPGRLKRRIAELEAELRKKPAAPSPEIEALRGELGDRNRENLLLTEQLRERQAAIEGALGYLSNFVRTEGGMRVIDVKKLPGPKVIDHVAPPAPRDPPAKLPGEEAWPSAARPSGGVDLPKGERLILIAVAQHRSGVTRAQLTQLTGYKKSSRDAYIYRLRDKGYVTDDGNRIVATGPGTMALGAAYEPLPTGDALRRHWIEKLPPGERAMLEAAIACYPGPAHRDELTDATGYKKSSRDAYIARLAARELVVVDRAGVRVVDSLFG